ncbi:hypothetical protein PAXRUDRAFT_822699 [Paxillus rubicundulus Ve08.2h10]|uniref:Fork-head domain-containing protein n=1 Tax=Paxillus rubicundulus Ve08.2h10 TaxID=930991 RepID=A0A0D0DW72_9AGAM|nr:hypothetical protein PAXRUDRAFT_822699 [Paxillus rubicundulus Ve08.2h10]
MSNIKNLLNPGAHQCNSYQPAPGKRRPDDPESPVSMSDASANSTAERSPRAADKPLYRDHEPHPNCPDTLACLPDTNGRPQHTLPVILRCAILGSPKKRLTIREIYATMENKYAYFRNAGPTWKQSVRHHLSLNRLFERQPRPVTDPGFGSYWTVNLSAPPGTKRPRKRGRTSKSVTQPSQNEPGHQKKRGRPRKDPEASGSVTSVTATAGTSCSVQQRQVPSIQMYGCNSEEHEAGENNKNRCSASEDEYESEEDMVVPPHHNSSMSGLGILGIRDVPSRMYSPERGHRFYDDGLFDRMQIEMATLRRQSADAISVSLRISDQLAEAQAEAARTKAALRAAESMLEEEGRKRSEAERIANEEIRLRRTAEETILRLQNQWHNRTS